MKKLISLVTLSLCFVFFAMNANAQITLAGSAGGTIDGTYATFTGPGALPNSGGGVFAALNANAQTGVENILISVTGNTTETGANSLNAGLWATILVTPSGGAWTCSGAPAAGTPLMNFNGADNVTINGLNISGNALTISNTTVGTTAGTCTIRFIADASNNTITNCSILGSSTSIMATAGGTIVFSTGTTTGNDNNTISGCNLGPAGATLPSKAIMASGTSAAIENDNALITGNNIFDYYLPTASNSGINILTGNEGWTISNNRFYQTNPRTATTTAVRNSAITLNNSTGSFTVSGNIIGFATSAGTGTYTVSGSSNEFRGIDAASVNTTVVTSIQGNIISGINQTTSRFSTSVTLSPFIGILCGSTDGLFNVGNISGNQIGSIDGSSTIVINESSVTASSAAVMGIFNFSFFGTNISNNKIGNFTIQQAAGAGTTTGFRGILVNTATGVSAILNENEVAFINNTLTGGYAMYGIQSSLPNSTIYKNTVRNMTGRGNTLNTITMGGILTSGSTGLNIIEKNDVHNLTNTITGTNTGAVYGLSLSLPSVAANEVKQNYVYNLDAITTITTYQVWGIARSGAGSATVYNNMVTIGFKADGNPITSPLSLMGIFDGGTVGPFNYYYNSVYVAGSGVTAGGSNSFAMFSNSTVTREFKNNIFWNARSNAAGGGTAHFAVTYAGAVPNPPGLTSNYNDLIATGTDGVLGLFNAINQPTLLAWQTATGQDANSSSVTVNFVNPASGNLHLDGSSVGNIDLVGTPIPGITTDIDKQERDPLYPYMGAHEAPEMLPVELASFTASVNGRNVDLNWSTTSERNNTGFDIERSAANGVWSKIGNVAGSGTTNTNINYSFTDRNVASGNFSYRLKQIDFNGNFEYFNLNNEVNVGIPTKYELSQNYPNPFNPSTKINYDIPFDGKVSLTIFDMSGKEIASLVNEVKTAGYYSINFNASSLSSGTYFYRINAEGNGQNFVSTKKMMLVK